MSRRPEVCVVGAGAAGLVAATEAARAGARVVLLEKNERPGVKIRISGGGRCNVTTALSPREAEGEFGERGGRFLRHALHETPSERVRAWLAERGVATLVDAERKCWPVSGKARDVVRALVARALDAGVELRTSAAVRRVLRLERGAWLVGLPGGELVCDRLVLACGGQSWPQTGTTGEGYEWLAELECELRPRFPALCALRSPEPWVRRLAGLALPEVDCQLREPGGRVAARRRRALLFTHEGISGPGPMDLCARFERARGRLLFFVDLCPDRDLDDLRARLFRGRASLATQLRREAGMPRRLALFLAGTDPPASQVAAGERRRVLEALRGLEIPVSGSCGFAQAELTAGGLALDEVDARTMQCRRQPGLLVAGELLDLDGPIGGFSFLAAFATGVLAGRAAARVTG